jgi:DNA mismatch repair protein MutH
MLPRMTPSPTCEADLLVLAHDLQGCTVAGLAAQLGLPPQDPRRHKGLAGQVLERMLGASAGSLAEPDFPHLGVELKTLPLRANGRPAESTWVTTVPLLNDQETWETSAVYRKLARVLWIPLLPHETGRVVGRPILWSPSARQLALLQADWEDLMESVVLGRLDELDGRRGEVLQVRPKAAHSGVRVPGLDADGFRAAVAPLGFYLRATFTTAILQPMTVEPTDR